MSSTAVALAENMRRNTAVDHAASHNKTTRKEPSAAVTHEAWLPDTPCMVGNHVK